MQQDPFNELFYKEYGDSTGEVGLDHVNNNIAHDVLEASKNWIQPDLSENQIGLENRKPETVFAIGAKNFTFPTLFFHVISLDLLFVLDNYGIDFFRKMIKSFSSHDLISDTGINHFLEIINKEKGQFRNMEHAEKISDLIDKFFGIFINYMNDANFDKAVDLFIHVLNYGGSVKL